MVFIRYNGETSVELTDDHQQAEVIVVYLLNLGKALLVDKRRSSDRGPVVELLPQEEMLLEGKPVAPPLTPEVVHFIERLQVMPQQPGVFQSYMRQLVETMELKLAYMRPELGPPKLISVGPHFAPVMLMAPTVTFGRTSLRIWSLAARTRLSSRPGTR